MNRFTTKATRHSNHNTKAYLLYLVAPVILVAFFLVVQGMSNDNINKQMESLQNAIDRDIIHCYAVEGFYPPSLDYLKEHYGLTYNEDLFLIDYNPIGSNIRPNVVILMTNRQKQK